ncbi:alpha/beta fold hydrolase [Actinoplanes aureus]|uniref:Alpha/beta fold hydrolase n=1 Tax=Actinoplanes aureus TaxID=2792083 RepID=A0A931CHD9_9ACTN|nr:alpha/beta fold hydrolase [Actinoplanes aureus]MBG0564970.1 alpha/beta fold hydrolase [Actinoplanes aureus]
MATVSVNGITLRCEEWGSGLPILGIHGIAGSARLWAGAVPELSARGRLILYDRRGCGRSERPVPYERTSIAEHADDAYALLHELDAVPAVLIGRSYGGEVALDLARRYPDAVIALILLEPALPTLSAPMRSWWRTVKHRVNAAGSPDAAAECLIREVFGDGGWDGLPRDVREVFRANGPAVLAEVNGEWTAPDARTFGGLNRPTLLISAADSPPPFRAADQALAGLLPRVRHEMVGGGHLVDPAGPQVLAFLDGVLRERADLAPDRPGRGD